MTTGHAPAPGQGIEGLAGKVYVPVDGSDQGLAAARIASRLAGLAGGRIVASHVFGARLHDRRFRQMEGGLPERYHQEEILLRQRKVHEDLISRGLRLISHSYLDQVDDLAGPQGVPVERRCLEGRNWRALLDDVVQTQPDLLVIGALGLGATGRSGVGSVCERLVRRLGCCDALVVRRDGRTPWERLLVALDGSEQSWGALDSACALADATSARVDLVSSFDPNFHHGAFDAIGRSLSEEAASVFRIQQQRALHGEIIDDGLARIYRGHLEAAGRRAAEMGVAVCASDLLAGKAPDCLEDHVRRTRPDLVLLGRTGVHSDGDLDLGSCAERLLRTDLSCDVWLGSRSGAPPPSEDSGEGLPWTVEARELLAAVPGFVRGMVSSVIVRAAREAGETIVSSQRVREVQEAAGMGGTAAREQAASSGPPLPWAPDAESMLSRIPGGFMAVQARAAIEHRARLLGLRMVDVAAVRTQYQAWEEGGARTERELLWEEGALGRLQRIPGFVRGGVIAEVERRAWERGSDRVTLALYEEVVSSWSGGGGFHS